VERTLGELVGTVRRAGVRVSTAEAIDVARAVEAVGLHDRHDLARALRSVLAKEPRDRARVDRAVAAFFAARGETHADLYERLAARGFSPDEVRFLRDTLAATARSDAAPGVFGALVQGPLAIDRLIELAGERVALRGTRDPARTGFLTMRLLDAARVPRAETELGALTSRLRDALGERGTALGEVLADELAALRGRARSYVAGQLTSERPSEGLAHVPFVTLEPGEVAAVERAVRELAQRLIGRALVRSRHARRGSLDVRATLRRALTTGGVPFEVEYRGKRPRKARLVLLCDVSDSVRASARFMLLFVHAVQRIFADARSFVFVSELADASAVFKREPAQRAVELAYGGSLVRVSDNSHYGRVWRRMRERHADALDARTTLVVLGDGRTNHFDPGEQAFAELAARVERVLWLSPEPESTWRSGDSALPLYRPHCDQVLPVYDLSSLKVAARALARS
jgi:uncharacterized protein with von Willebrand factor type A (vWA) domain